MSESGRPFLRAFALVAVVLAAAGGAYLAWHATRGSGPVDPHIPGFREDLAASGIKFRMSFLPTEQGEKFKINLYDHGSGIAVGDFDGDGHDDIYFVNQLGTNALYRNKGDGTFEDVTARAGVGLGDRICVSATFADFDNDGHQDLFVTSTRGGNVLFRNKGDGTFEDITKQAGLTHAGHSQMAVFFDYDNDGWLDLLLLQTAQWTTDAIDEKDKHYLGKETLPQVAQSAREYNILYRNLPVDPNDPAKGRRFVNATDTSGLRGLGWAADAALFDYDGDGRLDVLITSMFGRSQLYRNNGNGTFTDVTLDTLGKTPWGGMGARAFDFNNDGKLDLYIVDMHSDMWATDKTDPAIVEEKKRYEYLLGPLHKNRPEDVVQERQIADLVQVRYDDVVFGNAFYKNLGGGKFAEVSGTANLETFWPWGIAAGDFDNDGFQDVFVSAGMGYPFFYWPNSLLMNNGNETFTDRAKREGIEPPAVKDFLDPRMQSRSPRSSRCAAVADFDGDGRLDIITNNFNDVPYYFRNQFPKKNYVAWRLTGTKSNRDAIGATVTLHIGNETLIRQVHSAGGYLTQSSRVLHFGLGDRAQIDRAVIRWPSGQEQAIATPALNQLHKVTEK